MGNCSVNNKAHQYNNPALLTSGSGSFENSCVIHDGPVLGINYADEQTLVSCGDDRRIAIVDLQSLLHSKSYCPKYLLGHTKAVNRVRSVGSKIWSSSRDLSLRLWDRESLQNERTIENAHELNITGIAQSSFDRTLIVSGSRDYSVKCWDIESGKCTLTCSAPRNIVTTLEPSPVSAGVLYQGSEDLFIRVWDTRAASSSAGPAQVISGFVYFPVCMSVHPDGNLLATGCKGFDGVGCTVKLWDLRATAQPVAEYASHSQDVVGCAFSSRDPDLLLSTSKDGSIRVWDTTSASSDPKVAAFASIPHTGKLNSCLAVPITPMQDLAIAKSAVYEQPMDGGSTGSSPLDDNHVAVGAMDGSITLASMRRERTGDSCRGALTVYCTTAARQGDGNDNE